MINKPKPFAVQIGPIVFNIVWDDLRAVKEAVQRATEYDEEREALENVRFEGCITYQDSTISINKALELDYKKVVLMHEIMHAISTHTRANLTEEQCDQLAYALVDFMKINTPTVAWIQATGEEE
jgi:hypothetical protein